MSSTTNVEQGKLLGVFEKVSARLEHLEPENIELLRTLVGFNTADPPAGNCAEAQSWLETYIKNKIGDVSTEMFEDFAGDPHLVATFESKARNGHSIVLNGHIDVAEVRPDENWTYGPFNPTVRDGFLYGRGASDMKAGLASMISGIRAIKECNIELGGDVIFQSVTGEEAGEAGTRSCIAKGHRGDFAIVAEPTNFKIQGQGGVVTCWLKIKSKETYHDAMRRRMIHAGGGVDGASAIEKMQKIIFSLQELERQWAVMKSHPKMPAGSTTINPSVIHGGRHPAFVADECKLWLTVHMLPNETYKQVQDELESYVKAVCNADPWLSRNQVEFEWGGRSMFRHTGEVFPPAEIEESSPPIQTLLNSHKLVIGEPDPVSIMPSVTDAGWFADAGIPVAIYGPGDFAQAHTIDEHVKLSDVHNAAKVFAHVLLSWCGFV